MMWMPILFFVAGLALMVVGAELLVRGSSRLATMLGISPLVVGLTVVAFGTSAPEFAVSSKAALSGQADICVGNVVGSNIFNILFILGLSSIVAPLIVSRQLIRFDLPLVIGVSIVTLLIGLDGSFGRVDGIVLFSSLLIYTIGLIYVSRKRGRTEAGDGAKESLNESNDKPFGIRVLSNTIFVLIGLGMLVLGANWLVDTAVQFARWLDVSELVIGLTIIAIGTSLPEVVTSLVATLKGERDIAVGNVVGSNLFNILGVLGMASMIAPSGLPLTSQIVQFDLPVMIAVAMVALPIFFTGGKISRGEGFLLLAFYIAYTLFLILDANDDPRSESLGNAIVFVAVPITATVLLVQCVRWNKVRTTLDA